MCLHQRAIVAKQAICHIRADKGIYKGRFAPNKFVFGLKPEFAVSLSNENVDRQSKVLSSGADAGF